MKLFIFVLLKSLAEVFTLLDYDLLLSGYLIIPLMLLDQIILISVYNLLSYIQKSSLHLVLELFKFFFLFLECLYTLDHILELALVDQFVELLLDRCEPILKLVDAFLDHLAHFAILPACRFLFGQ